jgi:Carboxypeptidase regulatory-like domain
MRFTKSSLVPLILLLVTSTAWCSTITGRVTLDGGAPIARASLEFSSSQDRQAAMTADDGTYYVKGLKSGPYTIQINLHGAVLTRAVNLTGGDQAIDVAVTFHEAGWSPYNVKIATGLDRDLVSLLSPYMKKVRFYVEPNIPKPKQRSAQQAIGIPEDEHIFALVDATLFGTADEALVFGAKGVYYRTDWTKASERPRKSALFYADFPDTSFHKLGYMEVAFGDSRSFVVATCPFSVDELVTLMNGIRDAVIRRAATNQ